MALMKCNNRCRLSWRGSRQLKKREKKLSRNSSRTSPPFNKRLLAGYSVALCGAQVYISFSHQLAAEFEEKRSELQVQHHATLVNI